VVLSTDLFRLEPREMLDARVDVTVVGGDVVHAAG
jgi:predicted amidohydrolase YtcJ